MGKFDGTRNELIRFLSAADGQDYDAVYYFLGERDYDRGSIHALGQVADFFLEKASSFGQYPYRNINPIDKFSLVYPHGENAPERMHDFIEARKAREAEAEKNGATYIPESVRFTELMISAGYFGTISDEQAEIRERKLMAGQPYRRSVHKKTWSEQVRDAEPSEWIFLIIVAILSFLGCVSALS